MVSDFGGLTTFKTVCIVVDPLLAVDSQELCYPTDDRNTTLLESYIFFVIIFNKVEVFPQSDYSM